MTHYELIKLLRIFRYSCFGRIARITLRTFSFLFFLLIFVNLASGSAYNYFSAQKSLFQFSSLKWHTVVLLGRCKKKKKKIDHSKLTERDWGCEVAKAYLINLKTCWQVGRSISVSRMHRPFNLMEAKQINTLQTQESDCLRLNQCSWQEAAHTMDVFISCPFTLACTAWPPLYKAVWLPLFLTSYT